MKRAFTLAEVTVYSLLCLLASGLLLRLLIDARRMFSQTSATFLVDRAFDRALLRLRQDLEETSLSSIRVYPAPAGTPGDQEPAGLTLASAGGTVTREGTPRWNRSVFYTLEADSGRLLRWEKPLELPGQQPTPSPLLPSLSRGASPETVLQDVQPPAGFQVAFVRRSGGQESLSNWNPAEVSLGKGELEVGGNTSLIDLELRVSRPADSVSAALVAVVRCRICPRTRL